MTQLNNEQIEKYSNSLVDEILNVNYYDLKKVRDDVITGSEFSDPIKIIVLKRRLKDELSRLPVNPDENLESLFGSAIHEILEKMDKKRKDPSIMTEKRMKWRVQQIGIWGKFDRVNLRTNTLEDYKSTNLWSHLYDLEGKKHVIQTSIYRWLFWKRYKVLLNDKALIVRFIRDFSNVSKLGAKWLDVAPKRGIVPVMVDTMSIDETKQFIDDVIYEFKTLMSAYIGKVQSIDCTEEEMWTGWDRTKKCTVRRRCDKYCKVAPFCTQYKEWNKNNA